jgi:hypothetical protein
MDLQPSEAFASLARLRQSVTRGDWSSVEAIASGIRRHSLPTTPDGLTAYLKELKETLIAIKVWRANSRASLVRLNAASRFHSTGMEASRERQNSAVSTGF